jgi:hypothetical protein
MGLFRDITGYDSPTDMFDGGGPGASRDSSSSGSSSSSSDNSGGGDNTFVDPYEYLDLRDQGYSDTAAFERSYYDENPSYNIGSDREARPNAASSSERAFYDANPNTNISQADYERNQKIAKALTIFTGPLGLAVGTIGRLQRAGIIPATGSNLSQEGNNVPAVDLAAGNAENDKAINDILDNPDLTNEEKASAIQSSLNDMMNLQASQGLADIGLNQVQPMMDYIFNDLTATSNPENMLSDTSSLIGDDRKLSNKREGFSEADKLSGLDPNDPNYQYTERERDDIDLAGTSGLAAPNYTDPTTYTADTSLSALDDLKNIATAKTGTVSDNVLVDADQIDLEGSFSGVNEDGSVNYVGKALNDAATIKLSNLVDTTTVEGKLLADTLGEGNYVDAKASLMFQMEKLSEAFVDSNGNPTIPAFAAKTARAVSKMLGINGMRGGDTASVAAMSNALLEASLPIAEAESKLYQSLTEKNLDNRQQALMQKALVLSKFEEANLTANQEAAINNAKAFLAMDLKNLDNEQQTEILNISSRVDAIFEDMKAKNTQRLFTAEAENDFRRFYDGLQFEADVVVKKALDTIEMFNAGETNDGNEFYQTLDAGFEKFYKDFQFNADLAVEKWRQSLVLAEAEMDFDAARFDIESSLGLSKEALAQIWDREDAFLDYSWKTTEKYLDRLVEQYKADRNYDLEEDRLEFEQDSAAGRSRYELIKFGADLVFDDDDIWDWFT